MKSLHQQLADKLRQIASDEALVAEDRHLRETHEAKHRLPRLRREVATLETDIEVASAALYELDRALVHMGTQANGSRELSIAINEAETAAWRLRNHLGTAPAPLEDLPKLPPRIPQPAPR